MRKVTLCFLVQGDKICLAMKKRGFGEGKWNGVGGKLQEGETLEEATIREIKEEIGVSAKVEDLENVGNIKFFFNEKPDWNQRMYVYFLHRWEGEPQESEEMAPKWYLKSDLPYDSMWVSDLYWLPQVLEGKKIEGECYFNGDGGEVDKFILNELVTK